jgi:hypothetical protein
VGTGRISVQVDALCWMVKHGHSFAEVLIRNAKIDLAVVEAFGVPLPADGEFCADGTLNGELVDRLLQSGNDDRLFQLALRTGNRDPRASFYGSAEMFTMFGTHRPRFLDLAAAHRRGDLLQRLAKQDFDMRAEHAGERTIVDCARLAPSACSQMVFHKQDSRQ